MYRNQFVNQHFCVRIYTGLLKLNGKKKVNQKPFYLKDIDERYADKQISTSNIFNTISHQENANQTIIELPTEHS